jgi:hypothetical protein
MWIDLQMQCILIRTGALLLLEHVVTGGFEHSDHEKGRATCKIVALATLYNTKWP